MMRFKHTLFTVFTLTSLFGLSQSTSSNSPFDHESSKKEIHQWQKKHFKRSDPSVPKPSTLKIKSEKVDRVIHKCQSKFLLGSNIAWNKFYYDLSVANYDANHFETMFTQVQAEGGNSMRFWLHTNGATNPLYNDGVDPLKCTGITSNDTTNLKDLLDRAKNHGISIQICIWTHNMLSTLQTEVTQAVRDRNRAILEDTTYTKHYINNALTHFVKATKGHPALLAWEVFNEPEGIGGAPHNPAESSYGKWPDFEHTEMKYIQTTINLIAGAIHRIDPKALVTNGALDVESCTDVDGNVNYYKDDSLINRGGDPDGYLDFYTTHYYTWAGESHSPFHHKVDYWQLDKPLVIAEFYPQSTFGIHKDSLFLNLYENGYAGAWGWTYSTSSLWTDMKKGISEAHSKYSADINWENTDCSMLNALFNANKITSCTGADVTFTDQSSNSPDSWSWNFGEGASPATITGKGPHVVTYSTSGLKTIQLTVQKGATIDVETLSDYVTVNTGHQVALVASDMHTCNGTEITFNSTITPTLVVNPSVVLVPSGAGGFTHVTTIKTYDVNSDGTSTPDLTNLSRYLHGSGKPKYTNYVNFSGYFSATSTASITSKATSGSQSLEISIDDVIQGTSVLNGVQTYSANVPQGFHKITFKNTSTDWIEVDQYVFTDIEEKISYKWYLNSNLLGYETSKNLASTTLNHLDKINVVASSSVFNCAVPSLTSNEITMDCKVTSVDSKPHAGSLTAFPNPSSGEFTLLADKDQFVQVFNNMGMEVFSVNLLKGQAFTTALSLSPGIYLVVATNERTSGEILKIIKN